MAVNDFLAFATDTGANVESQASYAGSGHQRVGFEPGMALSSQLNKAWRQSASIGALIGGFMFNHGQNAHDDGNIPVLITNFEAALTDFIDNGIYPVTNAQLDVMPSFTIKGNTHSITRTPQDFILTSNSGEFTFNWHTSPSDLLDLAITDGSLVNSRLANMPAFTFKANNTGGAAAPQDITTAAARAMLDVKTVHTFTSAQLAITSGGAPAAIAHGLGVIPDIVTIWLVCQTAEEGYGVGSWIMFASSTMAGALSLTENSGVALQWDTTNVNVQYGSASSVFAIQSRSTGPGHSNVLTNANWKMVIKAVSFA